MKKPSQGTFFTLGLQPEQVLQSLPAHLKKHLDSATVSMKRENRERKGERAENNKLGEGE